MPAAAYLTAFMLPPGMVAGQMIQHERMGSSLVSTLFMADPDEVGALRLDVASIDPEYKARAKEAFYADLSDAQFEAALEHLHPDEPAQVAGVPSTVSADLFGQVPRHYIECTQNRAVTIEGQREMVRLMDDAMGNSTHMHTMKCSHSPFHTQLRQLAQLISSIAG